MKTKPHLILLLTLLTTVAIAPATAQDYRIGEGDVLSITVYKQPDLDKVVRVSHAGSVLLPLIGPVRAKGRTVAELSSDITALLADGYLVDPHVSVYIEEFRGQKVTILGAVNGPGLYEISGDISFLELVSRAGGFTSLAGDEAMVERQSATGQEGKQKLRVDLKGFLERGDTSADIALIDGDSIFVKQAAMVYVNGEVRNPDVFKHQQNMTVIKAITLANGLTEKAAPSNISVIRKIDGKEKVYKQVKMDMPILPEDIVVVPESFF
jgi:polysaccharide export outer membrane protein